MKYCPLLRYVTIPFRVLFEPLPPSCSACIFLSYRQRFYLAFVLVLVRQLMNPCHLFSSFDQLHDEQSLKIRCTDLRIPEHDDPQ